MSTPNRSGATTPVDEENPRHSRMMIWLVLMVVVLLALAIVLGAVLGTFINPGGRLSHSSASVTDIPAGPTPTPPAPRSHISSLAVAGWKVDGLSGYFSVWLFSQDSSGFLSRSTFNSSTGNWTRVSHFAAAKPGTPLAATALNAEYYNDQSNYSFPGIHYQAEVLYLDEFKWNFPDNGPAAGLPGSLNKEKHTASPGSDLAFYWPKLVYQSHSGEIHEIDFYCEERESCWHDSVLRTSEPHNGTQMVMVPMKNQLSSTALFYQQEDGTIVNYREDGGRRSELWTNRAFSNLIPTTSSVTAFSTVRPDDCNGSLNTYLLWQDKDGAILMSWSDNDEGWKGPTKYPAFDGADNGTAIACLSGLTFPDFPLSAGHELSRCYFQAVGSVREVSFDGASWAIVGNVPIDL
ncbi:hypothetical protein K469DRAFT_675587 [Zopfia rhizophila CBS 207.26]|uniref:Fucose-specific lectin n=1 Tax=Zopfia rhizophila CBS 207.26 TaxID=1314779 RepID=A0A6A6DJJ8_9PEZI|nr:hypothetical protein K469DRAFT_675587 [Zopfia rhizophila CBS 207.26]